MSRRINGLRSLSLVLILVGSVPVVGQAGSGRYSNVPAMGPDGPIFNPVMTPEYRQAGGNWEVYEQLMAQKMMQQQQKEAMAYQKQMDAYFKANPAAKKQMEAQQKAYQQALEKQQRELLGLNRHRKSTKKSATSKTKDATKDADTTETRTTSAPVAGAPATPPVPTTSAKAKK